MKNDPSSPFNQDSMAHFHPLNYYKINPDVANIEDATSSTGAGSLFSFRNLAEDHRRKPVGIYLFLNRISYLTSTNDRTILFAWQKAKIQKIWFWKSVWIWPVNWALSA